MTGNFGDQILPTVVSQVDASGLLSAGKDTYGNVGIVGLAAAGTEDKVYEFLSANEAKNTFQGGEMLDVLRHCYLAGAERVYAVRCGSPVAAHRDFANSTNLDAVTLTAVNKGANGNAIEIKITEGTPTTNRILSVRQDDDYNTYLKTYDDGGTGYSSVALLEAAVTADTSAIVAMTDDGTGDLPDVTSGWVPLVSGTNGARSTQEVSDALDKLLPYPVDIVLLDTADDTYHSIALGHCTEASNGTNRSERTCVVGMIKTKTVANYVTAATNLANKRAVVVAPCIETPDFTLGPSSKSVKDGHIGAGVIGGMKAGLSDPAEPLTNKTVGIITGLEVTYTNTELEQLVSGHVMPIALRDKGNVVIKQQTTSSESGFEEWSVVTSIDYVMKDLRNALEIFIGRKGTAATLDAILAFVKAKLSSYVTQEILYAFVENSISVEFDSLDQRWVNVGFSAVPIMPVNVIAISGAFSSIFSLSLTTEVAA